MDCVLTFMGEAMNERINELIEECTSVNYDLVYDGSDSYMQTTEYFDKEKFAELVAAQEREKCAKLVVNLFDPADNVAEFIAEQIRARGTT